MLKFIIILLALLGEGYAIFLKILRYRSANNPTPANVADIYDAETYLKWKQYSAEHCKLDIGFGIVSFAVTLILLITNAHAAFASLFPGGEKMQLYAVILLMFIIDTLFDIPKSYISTMVIEQKYGFNRSTMKTFVTDMIRSTILSFIIMAGLATIMMNLHHLTGDYLMLFFALVIFIISLAITFLYPLFSRLGNKFTPLEDGELKDRLMALLSKYGYKVKAIEVMDASRRTTKLNAYFTGFGKMKTIVLYDNLLNAMTSDEICAVFAHEMGHGLHKDILKRQVLNVGYMLLLGLLVDLAVSAPMLCEAFGFEGLNYGFAFILVSIGLAIVQPLTNLLINANSRAAEYCADRQAVEEGYGEAMISALKKLAKDNFAHLAPSRINVLLEYSHPPVSERVEAVEKALRTQK
ncbi:MAG: M48 family metallopeptidase [Clostridia bacterium]|nr:M48 family metallopeptidase [Clostridia bacterium]